jgi:L-threonylcarbamoyladenylate synthase
MRRLSVAEVRRVRAHLSCGGVIAYATESCFGLGCDPDNERALRAVLRLKHRAKSKGLIVVGDRFERFSSLLCDVGNDEMKRMQATWPGPHTWLVTAKARTKRSLRGRHSKLAVRVTAHMDTKNLCVRLAAALVSTSANRAGQRPVRTTRECQRRFGGKVMVIPGRIGTRKNPSTIQDFSTGKLFR